MPYRYYRGVPDVVEVGCLSSVEKIPGFVIRGHGNSPNAFVVVDTAFLEMVRSTTLLIHSLFFRFQYTSNMS